MNHQDEDPTAAYRGVLLGLIISAAALVVAFVAVVLAVTCT